MAKRTYRSRPAQATHPRTARAWDWAEGRFGRLRAVTYNSRSTADGFRCEYEFRLADGTRVVKAEGEIS